MSEHLASSFTKHTVVCIKYSLSGTSEEKYTAFNNSFIVPLFNSNFCSKLMKTGKI